MSNFLVSQYSKKSCGGWIKLVASLSSLGSVVGFEVVSGHLRRRRCGPVCSLEFGLESGFVCNLQYNLQCSLDFDPGLYLLSDRLRSLRHSFAGSLPAADLLLCPLSDRHLR